MDNHNFVSRGGIKLRAALDQFKVDVSNKIVLDVGSSTGGFVDCLLQSGATRVYAVDTAYGELDWKLRNNPKVKVLERTNILHLQPLPEMVHLVTIDAGWTRLELILPIVSKFIEPGGKIIALFKPQYEVDQKVLQKGVVPENLLNGVLERSLTKLRNLGFIPLQIIESPILGKSGNKEYLLIF